MCIYYRLLRRGGIYNGGNDDYPRYYLTSSVASTNIRYVGIFFLLGYVEPTLPFSNTIYKLASPSYIAKGNVGTVLILYY